jgi:predicted Fe-Mo cluster-binding NifX family protein
MLPKRPAKTNRTAYIVVYNIVMDIYGSGTNDAQYSAEVSIMRIAIPTYGERVSPRIDCAGSFLVVEAEKGTMNDIHEAWAEGSELHCLFDLLVRERIDVVLCGGIGREDRVALETAGIEVNWGWAGDVKDVLKGFVSGRRGGSCWVPDGHYDQTD